jgi:glucose-6-phosphate 1-dehydrogenase
LFYLAVAPRFFGPIATRLGEHGLAAQTRSGNGNGGGVWRRVIIEKPFGHDLDSARELARTLKRSLSEDQIYPIDHFTGKETVQNIMAFRFANDVFEQLFTRNSIDHIQISAAESLGVEKRGGYYDHAGATRDMLQNHVLSVLCLIAMDPPTSLEGDAVRNEKLRVLEAIRPMTEAEIAANCVRGQYGSGRVADTNVQGYRHEPDVDPRSATETYSAMTLFVENWRWAGVPFYIRSGKRLPEKLTEIAIHFKPPPLLLFDKLPVDACGPNRLVIRIAPEEGFGFSVRAKVPGPKMELKTVPMAFKYSEFGQRTRATGYETLLYDCMIGEQSLFHRSDTIDASWRIMNPVLDYWAANPPTDFPNYPAGSWGPKAAEEMLARRGDSWWVATQG